MTQQTQTDQANPPEDFVERVKEILEHLYDFAHLQRHPLWENADDINGLQAQQVREEVLTAIEGLSPGPDVPFRSPNARLYNLLHLRYVETLSVQQTAHELGISERQAHRDLRRAEESVATVLWVMHNKTASEQPTAQQLTSLEQEMAQIDSERRAVDLISMLDNVRSAVSRLATQREIKLKVELLAEPVYIYTNEMLARQVLISLISRAVQHSQSGDFAIKLTVGQVGSVITLRFVPTQPDSISDIIDDTILQLLERLSWRVEEVSQINSLCQIELRVMEHGPTILILDDNIGLIDLLVHYLASHGCHVVAATTGDKGLRLAQELVPDAILLDIMMPHMDGWEVLQTLRTHPLTESIPVVICSVINDPELAYSLGASLIVPKPVRRDDILAALREIEII
jgi:CheY-like chemotaxis protein